MIDGGVMFGHGHCWSSPPIGGRFFLVRGKLITADQLAIVLARTCVSVVRQSSSTSVVLSIRDPRLLLLLLLLLLISLALSIGRHEAESFAE